MKKGTWFVKEIDGQPNLLIQGNYRGLYILEKDNNNRTWRLRNKIEGFDISSRYFEFINPTELLMSHEYKGVYKLGLDSAYTNVVNFTRLEIDKGISSSIVAYNDKLYYVYEDRIFSYDNRDNSLKRDSVFSGLFENEKFVSGKLINDKEGDRLWSFSNDQMLYIEPGKLTDEPKISAIPLSSQLRKSKLGFENILYIGDDNYLLGTTEGYIIIDLNKVEDKTYKIDLNTVSHNSLDRKMIPLDVTKKMNLKNKENNIHFTYSVADFNKLSTSFYQYRLLGMYDDWSAWSTDPEAVFENLPFGDYTFEARAKVGGKLSSNTLSSSFNIAKPWFLKPLAIALYVMAFIFIVLLTQYLNTRYYKKQRQKLLLKKEREIEFKELENQKQLMQFKNENLHLDIENKNRELGMATMNLVKRNELLNNIKDELSKSKSIDESKSVIKLINSSLNNTSDWRLFEEAFNNVDKDFMKKVKTLHPSITPNDLRLCAYLRLNLSSKEIAPLLNISHKSVEVKRYRLRKKMELDHDQSLSNYIIEL